MLGALIPFKDRGFPRDREVLKQMLAHSAFQELLAGRAHGKRRPAELHAIVIGYGLLLPIPQRRPIPDGHKANIVIVKTLTVLADLGALRAVHQRNVLSITHQGLSAIHNGAEVSTLGSEDPSLCEMVFDRDGFLEANLERGPTKVSDVDEDTGDEPASDECRESYFDCNAIII